MRFVAHGFEGPEHSSVQLRRRDKRATGFALATSESSQICSPVASEHKTLTVELLMKRTATAVWNGSLKEGKGTLTAPGGALKNTQYSFGSRFENGAGTNPEELIAAAHAGCFAMALSAELGGAGSTPEQLDATAEVTLENVAGKGWTVTTSHLILKAKVLIGVKVA